MITADKTPSVLCRRRQDNTDELAGKKSTGRQNAWAHPHQWAFTQALL